MTIQDEHIESIRRWRNAQMHVLRQCEIISTEQQKQYYEMHIWPTLEQPHPTNVLLAFLEKNILVGYGGLVHIAWENKRAEVSFLLDPSLTQNPKIYDHYFSAFLSLIKTLAFTHLSFNRLFTETFAFRTAHIETLEKNGFLPEGILRQHVWIDGMPVDSHMHGCLNNEK